MKSKPTIIPPGFACVKMSAIHADELIMVRSVINQEVVEAYAEHMENGGFSEFPPIDVFDVKGDGYLLADGWHRFRAMEKCGFDTTDVIVHRGNRDDALLFAIKANKAHGLRRTNADKRKSVELACLRWPALSSRSLAELCGVHHDLVQDVRNLADSGTSGKITGKDGKSYPAKRVSSPAADPEREDERKDAAESADSDREETSPEKDFNFNDWGEFLDAANEVSDGIALMETITVHPDKHMAARIVCRKIAERVDALHDRFIGKL